MVLMHIYSSITGLIVAQIFNAANGLFFVYISLPKASTHKIRHKKHYSIPTIDHSLWKYI